jgi:hypothetical protein
MFAPELARWLCNSHGTLGQAVRNDTGFYNSEIENPNSEIILPPA